MRIHFCSYVLLYDQIYIYFVSDAYIDYFMAPSQDIFNKVVKKCKELMKVWYKLLNDEATFKETKKVVYDPDVDLIPYLIDFPNKGSCLSLILFIILYPLYLLIHLSAPDLRLITRNIGSKYSVLVAIFVILLCLIWLIFWKLIYGCFIGGTSN